MSAHVELAGAAASLSVRDAYARINRGIAPPLATTVRCRKCNYYARVGEPYVPYVVYDDLSVGAESFIEIYLCPSHAAQATWISSCVNVQSLSAVDRGLRERWNKPRDWNYAEDYLRRYVRGYAEAVASIAMPSIATVDDTADTQNSDEEDIADAAMDDDDSDNYM